MVRPTGSLKTLARKRFPVPPERLRRGPLRRHAFTSRLRSPRLTSQLGLLLGAAVGVCFVTGLLSHWVQHPPSWFWWPAHPVWLYRVTQGLHVATGLAAIPLLTAKLWSVYPKLFAWPPVRDLLHALERGSVLLLVSAVGFQLVTGLLNIAAWYGAMPFAFLTGHYWTAWLAIGALALHIAVKLPVVRGALAHAPRVEAPPTGSLTRRGLLGAAAAAAGVVTLSTVGQTVSPLAALSVLAPRRPDIGPQGLPVNNSARSAGVGAAALDPGYRLSVRGPGATLSYSLAELAALPQVTVALPITCVEGWSAGGVWTGVRVADLMARVGGQPGHHSVRVTSLQRDSPYSASVLDPDHAGDPLTLIALRLNGEPLHVDHGYPARLIAPNRPGVLQTKWLSSVQVLP